MRKVITYFENPMQVMFADPDNCDEWLYGIGYKDEIICGCCGAVFKTKSICERVPEYNVFPIRPYADWDDLTDAIYGGEKPWSGERDMALSAAEDEEEWANEVNSIIYSHSNEATP